MAFAPWGGASWEQDLSLGHWEALLRPACLRDGSALLHRSPKPGAEEGCPGGLQKNQLPWAPLRPPGTFAVRRLSALLCQLNQHLLPSISSRSSPALLLPPLPDQLPPALPGPLALPAPLPPPRRPLPTFSPSLTSSSRPQPCSRAWPWARAAPGRRPWFPRGQRAGGGAPGHAGSCGPGTGLPAAILCRLRGGWHRPTGQICRAGSCGESWALGLLSALFCLPVPPCPSPFPLGPVFRLPVPPFLSPAVLCSLSPFLFSPSPSLSLSSFLSLYFPRRPSFLLPGPLGFSLSLLHRGPRLSVQLALCSEVKPIWLLDRPLSPC